MKDDPRLSMRGTVFLFMRESILKHLEATLKGQVREEDALLVEDVPSVGGQKHGR